MVITDDTTADDLAEAIRNLNDYAIKQPHVMSRDPKHPSRWDRAHEKLDALLLDWEAAR